MNMKEYWYYNNVRSYVTRTAQQNLSLLEYEILLHLPYSPDLSPTDYDFFFKLLDIFYAKNIPFLKLKSGMYLKNSWHQNL